MPACLRGVAQKKQLTDTDKQRNGIFPFLCLSVFLLCLFLCGSERNEVRPVQREHDKGDQDELQDDPGDGVEERARQKGGKGEFVADQPQKEHLHHAPNGTPRYHGNDKTAIK